MRLSGFFGVRAGAYIWQNTVYGRSFYLLFVGKAGSGTVVSTGRSRDVDIEQSLNHSIEDDEQSVVSSMKGKY